MHGVISVVHDVVTDILRDILAGQDLEYALSVANILI